MKIYLAGGFIQKNHSGIALMTNKLCSYFYINEKGPKGEEKVFFALIEKIRKESTEKG